MNLKRVMVTAAMVVVGAAGGAIGVAMPAQAVSGNGVIESGEFVLWQHSNYGNPLYDSFSGISNYNTGIYFVNSGVRLNDNASSIANYDTSNSVRTHVDAGNSGAYISVLPYGQASGNISWAYYSLGGFNDRLSSHRFL